MVQIDEQNLKQISQTVTSSLIREICTQIEDIEKQNLSKDVSLSLLKTLCKNSIYNNARNQVNLILEFSKGYNHFSIEFEKPDK